MRMGGRRKRRRKGEEKRKRGRESEKKEGEGEEIREIERRENGESGTKNAPLSPDAFPSTKLGNNITPIKGRLGKKNNSHRQRSFGAEPESFGGPPAKTAKP